MLPILLLILKIIGLVLLALLGLICVVLFTVLIVPVRYRLSGSYHQGTGHAKAGITWLLHAISVTVTYEKELDISVRILGFRLFNGDKGGQGKKDEDDIQEDLPDGEGVLSAETEAEANQEFSTETSDTASGEGLNMAEGQREDSIGENLFDKPDLDDDDEIFSDAPDPDGDDSLPDEPDSDEDEIFSDEPQLKKSVSKKRKKKENEQQTGSESAADKLRRTADSLKERWNHLMEQKEKLETFLKDERNHKTMKLLLRQLKKLLRHILPTKVRGKAVVGFDDPATTGKLLSGLSILYAWYGDKFEITPVFDQSILEIEGNIKGRVRAGTILACGVRILLDKNFRRLLRGLIKSGGK